MALKPIVNERLSDKVVQMIMNQIETKELLPGDKLPNEIELAETLRVSRGVVREAMTALQAREYVIRKPKEGTIVNPNIVSIMKGTSGISFKQATYLDLLEMRECIEKKTVEKVIANASDEELEELRGLVLNGKGIGNEKNSVDYYFHYRLAEISQNAMFMNFIDSYYDIIDEVKEKTSVKESRKEEIIKEHLAIVDALIARDKKAAKKAVVYHFDSVRKNIREKSAGKTKK